MFTELYNVKVLDLTRRLRIELALFSVSFYNSYIVRDV